MPPGVNNQPRNTGALPKSNRRNDRNREQSAANQFANRSSTYHGHAQHSNNLYQLDWKPVGERDHPSIAKNSNTRSISSAPSTSYQDISEFASHSCGRPHNHSADEFTHWQKMVPPTDSRTQSPPCLQGGKPSNVDRMPDRSQVESRLNQIRDYIRVTSTMMDSLNQSSDPRAQAQNEKLSRMVEDLHDSERKLTKLLEQYSAIFDENSENGRDEMDENGDVTREIQLRKKMEESQRKLAQLQEHQASLVGMQLRVRERLNEARQVQQVFLQQENENTASLPLQLPSNVEQLESETAALRGKLTQLQTKKKHMDHLVAELQSVEMNDRASGSSETTRNYGRDKAAELEAMKAQLAHLKALMEEATRVRECLDSTSEPEPDVEMNGEAAADMDIKDEDNGVNISFERQSDSDEMSHGKIRNIGDRPTVEDMQAVTRELREQSALLQTTRAELQRLKQPALSTLHSNSASMFPTATPPPSLALGSSEKKQSNTVNAETQPIQDKKRQIEDLMRKESSQASIINRDIGGPDLNSLRSSSSQISHTSTPANVWPPPTVIGGSNEQSVDGISSSDNLLDIGPQTTALENGFNGNWWSYPPPPMNQLQHGSSEYYRQLLLGSQAQQLQMMGTTIQQCCQLLWSQQRELQSMRSAITQLQLQLRQSQQVPQRANNIENNEEYSNLSRSVQHFGETLDASLPPSSSLPNLVSLPNSSPALSHAAATTSANSQQHQQQQLNNQVPPGNRANNYWDNFRSYSRQNLLSGNVKTMTDTTSGAVGNSVSSGNAATSSVNSSLMKDKRNREQSLENLPLPTLSGAETQYSVNLQLQSNLQQQERENAVTRSNILSNEVSQQQVDNLWEEAHSSFRLPSAVNDQHPLNNISSEMRDVLNSLISIYRRRPEYLVILLRDIKAISEDTRLRARLFKSLRDLQHDTQCLSNPLNEATYQTASESCQSSDEDSDVDAVADIGLETRPIIAELIASPPTVHAPLIDHLDVVGVFSLDCAGALPVASTIKPGYNEDLAEADQSRPDSSGNQQVPNVDEENDQGLEEAAGHAVSAQEIFESDVGLASLAEAEDERAEDHVLDKVPTRLHHH